MFDISVDALINPVNCVGVSGKGLAMSFKQRFPAAVQQYEALCKAGQVKTGSVNFIETGIESFPWMICFPTKQHWRDNSKSEWIESGLQNLAMQLESRAIRSMAVPALGCGLGNLRWSDMKPRIIEALIRLDIDIKIYEPL